MHCIGCVAAIRAAFDDFFKTVQTKETDKGVAMFARSAATKDAYESRIDELFSGAKASGPNSGVRVLDRSDVLDMLGFGNGPIHLAEGKVIKGQLGHPRMTALAWKKVPQWIEDPAAVFDSDTVPGALVMIAPEVINGATVRMTIEPNSEGGLNVNILTNAYDAPGFTPFARWFNSGLGRMVDQKAFPAVLSDSGLRLSSSAWQNKPGMNRILTEKNLAGYRKVNAPGLSRGENATGLSRQSVQDITDAIKARWANAPEIVVADSMDDPAIPQAVRDEDAQQRSQGATGAPEGFYYDGKVHVVANTMTKPGDVHQCVNHAGVLSCQFRTAFLKAPAGTPGQWAR